MSRILLILILSGEFILTTARARGDQDPDILLDEEVKEMTADDLEDILGSKSSGTETNTSNSFDIVDENSIDEEMNADPDQDPVKTNWMIVVIGCSVGFIVIMVTIGALFLCNLNKKGNRVLISSFPSYCIAFSSRRQEEVS